MIQTVCKFGWNKLLWRPLLEQREETPGTERKGLMGTLACGNERTARPSEPDRLYISFLFLCPSFACCHVSAVKRVKT